MEWLRLGPYVDMKDVKRYTDTEAISEFIPSQDG